MLGWPRERRREPISVALSRLEQLVLPRRDAHVEDLCDYLVAELGVDSERDDDVVVVCLRLAASGAGRFHQVLLARAERLRHLRADVRAWMTERAIVEPSRSLLLLALGEACSNAIEHAYVESVDGDGEVEVEIAEDGGQLLVEVRDFGTWRPVESRVDRGRGTGIMEAVSAGFTRHTGPGGTTVSFRLLTGAGAAA